MPRLFSDQPMKHRLLSFLLGLAAPLVLLLPGPAAAQQPGSLLIWPVNPVIEGDARAAALWLENPGKAPITLQVRIYAWAQEDGRNVYADQREIVGTPPIISIEPGQRQLVRVTRTAPPDVAEKPYRIVVDEIPVAQGPAAPGASVSFRMRYSLPLFSYPPRDGAKGKGKPPDPAPHIVWRTGADATGRYLEVRNAGAGHARLTEVDFASGATRSPVAQGLLGYILPGASMRWPLAGDAGTTGDLVATVNGQPGVVIDRWQD